MDAQELQDPGKSSRASRPWKGINDLDQKFE